jgi:hypothetical protein
MTWPNKIRYVILVLCSLCMASCVNSKRSNPLDSTVELLFIPKILEPTGGEQWFPGTPQTIRWIPATQVIDSLVSVQLICDSDTILLAQNYPNIGELAWFVPHSPSLNCRVRIVGKAGAAESPANFRIKDLPVLKKINTGIHEARSPSALREKVLFVSNISGNDDIWLLDQDDNSIIQQTSNNLSDREPAWFKPLGKIFAYTAVDTNSMKNIWITATEGLGAGSKRQVTDTGGEAPAWQNTEEQSQLALAYLSIDSDDPLIKQVVAARLNTQINALPLLGSPRFETRPFALSDQNLNNKNTFNSITWYFIDGNNILLYHTGLGENNFRLWQVGFPGQNFASATGTDFPISVRAKPSQPKLSPSGKWVAFSMDGDIWLASISGTSTTPLSFGKSRDSSPDWASETEIIFTRSEFPHSSRELWSLQVSNPP